MLLHSPTIIVSGGNAMMVPSGDAARFTCTGLRVSHPVIHALQNCSDILHLSALCKKYLGLTWELAARSVLIYMHARFMSFSGGIFQVLCT